jgi:hypothetical protein
MCASSSGREAAFFSASGAALSQEVADGKFNVQSACALITRYILQRLDQFLIGGTVNISVAMQCCTQQWRRCHDT